MWENTLDECRKHPFLMFQNRSLHLGSGSEIFAHIRQTKQKKPWETQDQRLSRHLGFQFQFFLESFFSLSFLFSSELVILCCTPPLRLPFTKHSFLKSLSRASHGLTQPHPCGSDPMIPALSTYVHITFQRRVSLSSG